MIYINADDFGLSNGINKGIVDCINKGCLNSVSIIPNGKCTSEGIKRLNFKKLKKISIHLNLNEFSPISNIKKIKKITYNNKLFISPLKLLLINFFVFGSKKNEYKKQIEYELDSQIKSVIFKITKKNITIGLDSHNHIHLIPFIFDIVCKLSKKYKIGYIRLPREKSIIRQFNLKYSIEFARNIVKVLAINFFCTIALFKKKKKILNENFHGSLYSGNFSLKKLEKVLMIAIKNKGTTEIISHPGYIFKKDKKLWVSKKNIQNYYSNKREVEANALQSIEIRKLFKKFFFKNK